jgi:short subunit dehydrogenase-like uncharacterized protein
MPSASPVPAPHCIIYGATGYSGRLIVTRALQLGLRPILAGRDPAELAAFGAKTGLSWRVAAVADGAALDGAFAGACVVLNAAGPFSQTADAVVEACFRGGAHYLDITGEVQVIERLVERHAEACRRRLMLMPAVGFDVVPTDCLAAHVARRLPGARRLATAVTQPRFLSAGSIKTLLDGVDVGVVRRDGAMQPQPIGSVEQQFDFGWGPVSCLNVSFADITTAYYTTGIPNVTTFVEAPPFVHVVLALSRAFAWALRAPPWQAAVQSWADVLPADSDLAHARDDVTMRVVAEAEDDQGRCARTRLRTPEAYALTAAAATAILARVLDGDFEPGFQTPARVYGPDFVLSLPGVEREDIE